MGLGEKRQTVGDADAEDDQDRAATAEEVGLPQDGPHVEDGAVTVALGRRQRVGDHRDANRPERRHRTHGEARAEEEQQGDENERTKAWDKRKSWPPRIALSTRSMIVPLPNINAAL